MLGLKLPHMQIGAFENFYPHHHDDCYQHHHLGGAVDFAQIIRTSLAGEGVKGSNRPCRLLHLFETHLRLPRNAPPPFPGYTGGHLGLKQTLCSVR